MNFKNYVWFLIFVGFFSSNAATQTAEPGKGDHEYSIRKISEELQKKLAQNGNEKSAESIRELGKIVGDPNADPRTRFSSILLLSSFKDENAVAILLKNIRFSDPTVVKGKYPESIDEYYRLGLISGSRKIVISDVFTPSVWAISKHGAFAIPQIVDFLKTADERQAACIGGALLLILGDYPSVASFVEKNHESIPPATATVLLRAIAVEH